MERLNVLVREMYALSLEHQCIISPGFVPTLENGAADFLSRPAVQLGDPIAQVTAIAVDMHFWAPGTVAVVGPYAGGTRTLDEERGVLRKEVGFQQVLSADAKVFHPSSLFLGKRAVWSRGRGWRSRELEVHYLAAPGGFAGVEGV